MDSLSFQLIVTGLILTTVLVTSLLYFFLVQRNAKNQHHLERQQLLLELQNKRLTVSFEERELMMTQVSKELHDNVGQIVHLSRMHLHVIEEKATDPDQLKLIKFVADLTDQMIRDTNHISHSLNSDFIKERGLARILEDDLEQIKTSTNIGCFLEVEGGNNFLEPEKQLLLYRIAQEAIHNTLKHANATLLEVKLLYSDAEFTMNILDNGNGFDEQKAKDKGLLGLVNMCQRAKMLNGELILKTQEGCGCIVKVVVPNLATTSNLVP